MYRVFQKIVSKWTSNVSTPPLATTGKLWFCTAVWSVNIFAALECPVSTIPTDKSSSTNACAADVSTWARFLSRSCLSAILFHVPLFASHGRNEKQTQWPTFPFTCVRWEALGIPIRHDGILAGQYRYAYLWLNIPGALECPILTSRHHKSSSLDVCGSRWRLGHASCQC